MRTRTQIRRWLAAAGLMAMACATLLAQSAPAALDRVVAVVNNQAILSSDVDNEMRLSALEPRGRDEGDPTPQDALQDLISRALIRQQIRQEEVPTASQANDQVQTRLDELRRELPACVRMHCSTDEGWKAFLSQHGLTQKQVENYLRMRLEILAFIEERFRQGIRIPREDVEKFYSDTLVPQYRNGGAPSLTKVAPRIEEILLQEQANALFGAWLDNLRKQGDVEILDPALESPSKNDSGKAGRP